MDKRELIQIKDVIFHILSDVEDVKTKLQKHEAAIEQFQQPQPDNLKKCIKFLEDRIINLQKEIEQLKKSQAELKNPSTKSDQNDEILNLKQSIKILTKSNQEMKDKLEEQNLKIERLLNEISKLQKSSTEPKAKLKEKAELNEENISNKYKTSKKSSQLSQFSPSLISYNNYNKNDDDKVNKLIENSFVEPFGIKNIGNSSYINSSLQCFLSLSIFISNIDNLISQNKKHILLSAFKSFILSHDPYEIKQIISEKNSFFYKNSKPDSFEFTISFINKLTNEIMKEESDLFIGKCQKIIKCTKCGSETVTEQCFSSIELFIQNSRNILYIPFSMKDHPLQMAQKPELSTNVKFIENKYANFLIGKNYILIAKDKNDNFTQFKIIKDFDPQFTNFYAFEIPEFIKNCYIIVQIKNEAGVLLTPPFICEIPLNKKIEKNDLIEILLKRLNENIDIVYRSQIDTIKKIIEISKPKKFPIKFESNSKVDQMICTDFVNIKVYQENVFNFNNRIERNQKIDFSLDQLFKSHIQQYQLKQSCKTICDSCEKRSRVLQRIKYIKLPKILIFKIKRNKDEARVYLPPIISIGTFGDFNEISVYPYHDDDDETTKFQLMAISHHIGSFDGGHFWTDGKRGGKWFNFNDLQVEPISESMQATGSSYIAFYQQII